MSALGVVVAALAAHRLHRRAGLLGLVCAGAALAAVWGDLACWWLHLDDALAVAGVLAAARLLGTPGPRRDQVAGLLLGLAVASKPWVAPLLVVPLLLPPARRGRVLPAAVLGALGPWLPFLLAAPATVGTLTGLHLTVAPDSLLTVLGLRAGDTSPGWVRPTQLLLGAVVAWVAARTAVRPTVTNPQPPDPDRWDSAIVAALGLVTVARVAVDAAGWTYYSAGAVVAVTALTLARAPRVLWVLPLLAVLALSGPVLLGHAWVAAAVAARVMLLVLTGLLVVRSSAPGRVADPAPTG